MPNCYAHHLGDCDGRIEDEHFIPRALQDMLGSVYVNGLAWQGGRAANFRSGVYAHGRVICQKHHDQLDGLDGIATAYFRNLMLIANPNHISSGIPGRVDDITPVLNGRALEKWFLKTICGAIATRNVDSVDVIPERWIDGLFDHIPWPDDWALYISTGTRTVTKQDAGFTIEFHWTNNHQLNGIVVKSFSINTLFAIERPDNLSPIYLRRPKLLGAAVERPNGGDVLVDLPAGSHILFHISWPS